jgi:hypothetical protein
MTTTFDHARSDHRSDLKADAWNRDSDSATWGTSPSPLNPCDGRPRWFSAASDFPLVSPPLPPPPFHRLIFQVDLSRLPQGEIEEAEIAIRYNHKGPQSPPLSPSTRTLLGYSSFMAKGWDTTSPPIPSTTWTSTTSGLSTSTGQLPNNWSIEIGKYPGTSPPPNQPSTSLSLTDSSISSLTPSPTRANSTETSVNPVAISRGKSLNVAAIAIGVTGAVLLLIVCAVTAFNLWKRKQRNKVPPSAEFKDLALHPKSPHRAAQSITSSVFASKDGISFTSPPYESTKFNTPVSPYSFHPNSPPGPS